MKKSISVTLILCIILSTLCISPPVFATEDNTVTTYRAFDLTEYATGKFWLSDTDEQNVLNYDTNTKGYKDFTINGDGWYCAAVWPMTAAAMYNNAVMELPTADSPRAKLHSASGVSYLLPKKTSTVAEKEAIILTGYGSTKSVTVDIGGNFDSLNFLIAHSDNLQRAGMTVSLTYSGEEATEMLNLEALPFKAKDAAAEANLLMDMSDKNATPNMSAYNNFAYPYKNLYLYEYSIGTDSTKTIESITFTGVWNGSSKNNFGIVSLTGGKETEPSPPGDTISGFKCIDPANGSVIHEAVKGMEFSVNFSVENPSPIDKNYKLFNAIYDTAGSLISATMESITVPFGGKECSITSCFPDDAFHHSKIMLWDENMKPCIAKNLPEGNGIHTMVDLTEFANGKFYVSKDNDEELHLVTYSGTDNAYGRFDFPWHNGGPQQKVAAYYPPADKSGNSILNEFGLLHPESDISYLMPRKRDGVENKEALALNYTYSPTVSVDLDNEVYSKMHFIVASSLSDKTKLKVVSTYTDGSREDSEYVTIHKHSGTTEANFITQLSKIAALNDNDFGWSGANYIQMALYEYSVSVNTSKVLDSITFSVINPNELETTPTHGIGNIMVTSLTTEKAPSEDVIAFINSKVSDSDYLEKEVPAIERLAECIENRGNEVSITFPEADTSGRAVYVATDGNDTTGDGSTASPYATIAKACEFISANSDYLGDWEIVLDGGKYELTETVNINREMLPSFASVTITSRSGETVEFTGSKTVDMTKAAAVGDEIKARLPLSSADKVVQVDLTAQGISSISPYTAARYGSERKAASQLIIDGKTYSAARWPNSGFAEIGEAIDTSEDGLGMAFTPAVSSSSNIANWSTAESALIHGFFSSNDWRSDIFEFAGMDADTGAVMTGITGIEGTDGTMSGIVALDTSIAADYPRRFFIENLLEEIDQPGEWYIDSNNILYLYPVEGAAEISLSIMTDEMFNISDINNVRFENLTLSGNVGEAVVFNSADNCEVYDCDISNITDAAISFNYCKNSGVQSCDMTYLGRSAVTNIESSYRTMTHGNIYVDDCKITTAATYTRNGSYGGIIRAVNSIGMKISHNEISDAPWAAIVMSHPVYANIEYNNIHHVQKEYGDAGAIYVGQSFISQGNTIQYNYIHHIEPYSSKINSQTVGIYMDDLNCGFTIHGNVINRASIGILLGGGKNLTVTNNAIIDGGVAKGIYSISTDNRGLEWAAEKAENAANILEDLVIAHPLYAKEFPYVTGTYYTDQYGQPANNTIMNNFYYGKTDRIYSTWKDSTYNNSASGNYKFGTSTTDANPFVDIENEDFTVKEDVIAQMIPDFESIPFNEIGLKTVR